MRYEAILFDFDGTLVDSRRDLVAAFRAGVRHVRPEVELAPEGILALVGRPLADMAETLGLGLTSGELDTFVAGYRQCFEERRCQESSPFPGIVELLTELSGVRLAVVTAKGPNHARLALEAAGIHERFEWLQGKEDGLAHKPAPDTVLRALEVLGVAADQALMVGDTAEDVLAGRAAGTDTCAVTWGFRSEAVLMEAGPTHVARRAEDVLAIARGKRGQVPFRPHESFVDKAERPERKGT